MPTDIDRNAPILEVKAYSDLEHQTLFIFLLRPEPMWQAFVGYLEPLVHTLGMELVGAGQDTQQLFGLKVAHAHHAGRLV